MRKSYPIFTSNATVITSETLGSGITAVYYDNGNGERAIVLINPHSQALPYTLDGNWHLVANADEAGASVILDTSGEIVVNPIGVMVYVNDKCVK